MKRNFRKIIKGYGEYIKLYPKSLRILHNQIVHSTEDFKCAETKHLKPIPSNSDFKIFQPDHPLPQ